MSVEGVEGESLHAGLAELAVASGAACTSLTDEPSYVLRVLGRSAALARSSVRFSFGRPTTTGEIDRAAEIFARTVTRSAPAVAGQRDRRPTPGPGSPPARLLARGEAGSMEAGTWVVFTARVRDARVTRLDVQVYGCPHTQAACDRAVQLLTGGQLAELGTLDPLALGRGPRNSAGKGRPAANHSRCLAQLLGGLGQWALDRYPL